MKNVLHIYRIMLRYWGYLLLGVLFMLSFAVLSGVSITMVIPLFDYVFLPRKTISQYNTFAQFFNAIRDILSDFFMEIQNFLSLSKASNFEPLLNRFKEVLSVTEPITILYSVCIGIIILTVIKNIFFYLNKIMFANLRGRTIIDIRDQIFDKLLRQSFVFFNVNKIGDSLVRMISDVSIVSDMFIGSMFEVMRDVILLFVYARIALFLNPRLFLLSLVVLPVFSLCVALLGKKIKKYAKRIQAKFSDMFSDIEEVLNNMRIVKAFAREDHELNKFKKINRQYFQFWKKTIIYSAINVPLSEFNGVFTGVLVVVLGGSAVLAKDSTFTFGIFTAFIFSIFSMLHPMKTITTAYADIKKAMVSVDRIFEILNQKEDIVNSENPVSKKTFDDSIILKNVSFAYHQKAVTLKKISFEIHKGEKVALVGSSGSGKTTLVNLLPRMYDVSSGEIFIDGINIKDIDLKDLRTLFGTVTQDSILFSDTIANNIRYGSLAEISDEVVREAARISYADEFVEAMPEKYDSPLQQKGANLSGGQKQRLCIARAIVGNPPILIFDEATSALDTESEQKVQEAIEGATKNRTVIVIAHRLSTVLSSDKIVVLDKGSIVGIGTHKQLLRSCPKYQLLYNLQFDDQ